MNRYSNTPTTTRWDGKQVYNSTTYPVLTPQDTDIIIITDETMHLDTLADKYYSDTSLWFIIALANSGLGNGRLSIPAGTQLRIPTNVNSILNQFKLLNS